MPELPEVETVRTVLKKDIVGLSISQIDIRYPSIIDMNIEDFKNKVLNKKIKDIHRMI